MERKFDLSPFPRHLAIGVRKFRSDGKTYHVGTLRTGAKSHLRSAFYGSLIACVNGTAGTSLKIISPGTVKLLLEQCPGSRSYFAKFAPFPLSSSPADADLMCQGSELMPVYYFQMPEIPLPWEVRTPVKLAIFGSVVDFIGINENRDSMPAKSHLQARSFLAAAFEMPEKDVIVIRELEAALKRQRQVLSYANRLSGSGVVAESC